MDEAREIEVTPAMIEAGASAVSGFDPEWGSTADEVAIDTFVAMCEKAGVAVRVTRPEPREGAPVVYSIPVDMWRKLNSPNPADR